MSFLTPTCQKTTKAKITKLGAHECDMRVLRHPDVAMILGPKRGQQASRRCKGSALRGKAETVWLSGIRHT